MGDEPIVEVLAEEWAAILALGGGLTPDEWSRPTECPGWTVLDLVSHLIGIERTLLGERDRPRRCRRPTTSATTSVP